MTMDDDYEEWLAEQRNKWMEEERDKFNADHPERWNAFTQSDDIAERWHESEREACEELMEAGTDREAELRQEWAARQTD
jgi:hypothetical protein